MITIEELRKQNNPRDIIITEHANARMLSRGITRRDVIHIIETGEIIEQYPEAYPAPACLVLGFTHENRFAHVVLALMSGFVRVITAYFPDSEKWKPDFSTRR